MAAPIYDLVDDLRISPQKRDAIEQGADYGMALNFRAADTDGSQAGDWYVKMQVRRALADRDSGDPLLSLDSDELGGIELSIVADEVLGDKIAIAVAATSVQTSLMPIGKWYYDIKLVRLADGYGRRILEGRVQVKGRVTA